VVVEAQAQPCLSSEFRAPFLYDKNIVRLPPTTVNSYLQAYNNTLVQYS